MNPSFDVMRQQLLDHYEKKVGEPRFTQSDFYKFEYEIVKSPNGIIAYMYYLVLEDLTPEEAYLKANALIEENEEIHL